MVFTGMRGCDPARVRGDGGQVLPLRLLHRLGRQVRQDPDLGHGEQGAPDQERVPAHLRTHLRPLLVPGQPEDRLCGRGQGEIRPRLLVRHRDLQWGHHRTDKVPTGVFIEFAILW